MFAPAHLIDRSQGPARSKAEERRLARRCQRLVGRCFRRARQIENLRHGICDAGDSGLVAPVRGMAVVILMLRRLPSNIDHRDKLVVTRAALRHLTRHRHDARRHTILVAGSAISMMR